MDKELYEEILQEINNKQNIPIYLVDEWKEKLAKSLTAKIESRYRVIAEGEVIYKGTELMGTIGKDFMDVAMKKLSGKSGKLIWMEEK
jgi:hypothetical protein